MKYLKESLFLMGQVLIHHFSVYSGGVQNSHLSKIKIKTQIKIYR